MITNSIERNALDSTDRGGPRCSPVLLVRSSRKPIQKDKCPPASCVHRAVAASDDTANVTGRHFRWRFEGGKPQKL